VLQNDIGIMDKIEILEKLKESKEILEKNFSITKIGLFGSYATGQETADSDIDIFYELAAGKREGIIDAYNIENYFKQLLFGKEVDLVNAKYVNPIIENEIVNSIIYVFQTELNLHP